MNDLSTQIIELVIYRIRNTVNGKIYIGSTRNFYARKAQHLSCLRRGAHSSYLLQKEFIEMGESAFEFEPLEMETVEFKPKTRYSRGHNSNRERDLVLELQPAYNSRIPNYNSLRAKNMALIKELKEKQSAS